MIDIYSKENCDFCNKAKAYMKKHSIEYVEHQIGRDISRDDFIDLFPQAKTVPAILIDGKYIGGYMNLVEHFGGEHKRVEKK